MKYALMELLVFISVAQVSACPPQFYRSLPRDNDYYYGAGVGETPQGARDNALNSLMSQATGDASEPAGIVAGWEQDDADFCDGSYYALIRVEKKSANRASYVEKEFSDLKSMLIEEFTKIDGRLDAVETQINTLAQKPMTPPVVNNSTTFQVNNYKFSNNQAMAIVRALRQQQQQDNPMQLFQYEQSKNNFASYRPAATRLTQYSALYDRMTIPESQQ